MFVEAGGGVNIVRHRNGIRSCSDPAGLSRWSCHGGGGGVRESSASSVLQPPFHLGVVLDIVRRNEELVQDLRGEYLDDINAGCSGDIGSVRERLMALQRHALKLEEKEKAEKVIKLGGYVKRRGEEVGYGVDGTAGGINVANIVFLEVDDEFAASGGVVYIIALNHHLRRVTVAFRGSTTKYDFKTDLDLQLKTVDNPLWACSSSSSSSEYQAPTFKVHTGFHKYLFQRSKSELFTLNVWRMRAKSRESVRRLRQDSLDYSYCG